MVGSCPYSPVVGLAAKLRSNGTEPSGWMGLIGTGCTSVACPDPSASGFRPNVALDVGQGPPAPALAPSSGAATLETGGVSSSVDMDAARALGTAAGAACTMGWISSGVAELKGVTDGLSSAAAVAYGLAP